MEKQEREHALEGLTSSLALLQEATAGLTPAQWSFRESPERWSITDNIEHVIAVERRITAAMKKILSLPAEPEKRAQAEGKDEVVMKGGVNRSLKFTAPEPVRPVGKYTDPSEMMAELAATREATLKFVAETDGDLRNHFITHLAFGELDCYQWMLLLGRHGLRHTAQIEEVKADPAFPAA